MSTLATGLAAFVASVVLTPVARHVAWRLGAVAHPRADRWHERPTALGGGIAVALAAIVVLAFARGGRTGLLPLHAGAAMMLALGVVDDIHHLRPSVKFGVQVLTAAILPLAGIRLDWTGLAAVDALLTVAWIVGITNAINLVDNMDGLASGIVAIAATGMATVFVLRGQPLQALSAAALSGAAAGFLVFNSRPASIFLGDVGTMFLGYGLAGLAVFVDRSGPPHLAASVDVLVLLLVLPIFDTAYVTARRRLEDRPFWKGGRDHTSHALVEAGFSEGGAVMLLYGVGVMGAAAAVLLIEEHRVLGLWLLVPLGLALSTLGSTLARRPAPRGKVLAPAAPTPPDGTRPVHAFTVDVEDWYDGIPIDAATRAAATPRLERGLEALLGRLAAAGVHGTFFVLGPIAVRHPALVRRIADAGHELGCHGWSHELLYTMSPERFRDETVRARDAIEQCVGVPVRAYRAAYFSITRRSWWALEQLAALRFEVDSSVFPVRHWRYGIPGFVPRPQRIETAAGPIVEVPLPVRRVCGFGVPVTGGGYFRLYPWEMTRANLRAAEAHGESIVFYIHPWELDPGHPRVAFHWRSRLTHYANLRPTAPRLERMLREFRFASLGQLVERLGAAPGAQRESASALGFRR